MRHRRGGETGNHARFRGVCPQGLAGSSPALGTGREIASPMNKKSKAKPYFAVEFDRETDGRWIAEIPKLPGVMAYGSTKKEALQKTYAIALRTLADTIEHGGTPPRVTRLFDYEMARR